MTHKHNDGSDLPSFKCHTCGECCRHIHLVKELSHLHNGDGICVHLKNSKCEIYNNRPDVCNYSKLYKQVKHLYTPQEYHSLSVQICDEIMKLNEGNKCTR